MRAVPSPDIGGTSAPAADSGETDSASLLRRLSALEAEVVVSASSSAAQQAALDAAQAAARRSRILTTRSRLYHGSRHSTASAVTNAVAHLRLRRRGIQRLWRIKRSLRSRPRPQADVCARERERVLRFESVEGFQFLAEIDLACFPTARPPRPKAAGAFGSPVDTNVSDPSAANGVLHERALAGVSPETRDIDWTPSDAFTCVRACSPPYGIFNVDHGTPTRIMVSEPLFISSQLFPSQLIGIGSVRYVPVSTVDARLSLARQQRPHDRSVDFSDSKAVGGRLYSEHAQSDPDQARVSAYVGRFGDGETSFDVRTTNYSLTRSRCPRRVDRRGSLRIRSEVVVHWQYFDDGHRRVWAGTRRGRHAPRRLRRVRIPAALVRHRAADHDRVSTRSSFRELIPLGEGLIMPSVGVNVYFTSTTMLRNAGVDRTWL